jgi:diguanylate cyclase (GGDEF)-like protein
MEESFDRELARAMRHESTVGLIIFDIDNFKRFNDQYGHRAGDTALIQVGAMLRGIIRAEDVACRYGGEEFAILFPASNAASARAVAERVCVALGAERFEFDGKPFRITVSAGIADAAEAPADRDEVLFRADKALYAAKEAGRNRVETWKKDVGSRT